MWERDVLPGWEALFGETDTKEVGRYVKASPFKRVLRGAPAAAFPSVATFGEAAGLVRQGSFEWLATLRGLGAAGEEL